MQAVLGGVLLPWMTFRLSRRLFSDPAELAQPAGSDPSKDHQMGLARVQAISLLAAGLAAIYAYFALYAATLMTETFYMAALLWSLERALLVHQRLTQGCRVSFSLAATFGLSLGIAILLRQSILPWVAVLFVWLFWNGWRSAQIRNTVRMLVVAFVSIVLLILPFTIRNYHAYGRFLLLNSNAGYAMFSAQHPMHGTNFQEFVGVPLPDELWGRNEAELDQELMRRGISYVTMDPQRYLLLSLSRARAYFDFRPSAATSPVNAVGRVLAAGVFVPLMVYGIWLNAARYWRNERAQSGLVSQKIGKRTRRASMP